MALVLEIVLGLMILASFFVAYMSTRTWPIYQVVLVEFIFLGSVAFFYLGARTLATHQAWRTAVQTYEKQLETVDKQTQELREGVLDPSGQVTTKGISQLKEQLARLAMDRGGVFYDVAVDGVKDGVVQLTFKSPNHGLAPNSVLFAFDEARFKDGGRYQGEFKVASVAEDSPAVQLTPNLPLTESQTQRLAAAKGPWTLYSTMPIDDLTVDTSINDPPAPIKKDPAAEGEPGAEPVAGNEPPAEPVAAAEPVAPAEPAAGEPGAPAAPPVAFLAKRPLRDYEYLFHENYVQRSLLADTISQLTSNIDRMTAAVKQATEEIGYRETEKTNLAGDLGKFQTEQKAIAAYHKSMEKLYGELRESLKSTYFANKQAAAELTASQLKAAQEINQRAGDARAQN